MARTQLLECAPDSTVIEKIVQAVFDAPVVSFDRSGTGMLGYVFSVKIPVDPYEIIVKFQKYAGKAKPEAEQLDYLRIFANKIVPRVLHVHLPTEELPLEVLILEKLPGIQASSLKDPPLSVQEQIAKEIVDLLLKWHDVSHPQGYGPLNGPYYDKWSDFQKSLAMKHLDEVKSLPLDKPLPSIILEAAERSIESAEAILGDVSGEAVLVHGDIWLPNILIDPETYRVTGIVDPQNCRWDEREADVVPMDWPYGDYQFLMKVYQQRYPLREGWPLRFAFQRFWFMMEAMYLIGPDSAKGEAENLMRMLDKNRI